jgi:hypothetical protein
VPDQQRRGGHARWRSRHDGLQVTSRRRSPSTWPRPLRYAISSAASSRTIPSSAGSSTSRPAPRATPCPPCPAIASPRRGWKC